MRNETNKKQNYVTKHQCWARATFFSLSEERKGWHKNVTLAANDSGAKSIKESSTLAISTLYLGGEGRDHTCAVSDVPSRVELSSFIDSAPGREVSGRAARRGRHKHQIQIW